MQTDVLKMRLRSEFEDPDGQIGISVFTSWAYPAIVNARVLDEDLERLYAKFVMENDEDTLARFRLPWECEHDYDPNCSCNDCLERAIDEAEYYMDMRRDI